jgi:hypothetical protein
MIHDTSDARRRAPRLLVRLEGSLRGRTERAVSVIDLSLSGCLVRCASALDHGAILDLHLRLQDEAFGVKVQVTESSLDGASGTDEPARYLAGLAFLGLAAREEARLRRFLEDERRRRSADASPQ